MPLGVQLLYGEPGPWVGACAEKPKLQVLPRAQEVRKRLGPGRLSWSPQAQETPCRGLGKGTFSFGHSQNALENSTVFVEVTQCRYVYMPAKVLFILLLQKERAVA